ncbi:unnamed protein product [Blepharisma stoltei]|uniref:Uncharacterized protein n=1 Tax=Blepharisma stoltei TaxID=1481888 RepID=A0AAU9KB36_9CILI|nr:unnamed protein product [Blepharisma stoltei]
MDKLKCIIEGCQNLPAYICDCRSNTLICFPHVGPHIIPDKNRHNILELYVEPDSNTVKSVRSFLLLTFSWVDDLIYIKIDNNFKSWNKLILKNCKIFANQMVIRLSVRI